MENEDFYNYQAQFQMRQSEMEQKQCQLEKEMFSIMRSDKSLHSLQTNKLRSHWKAVCERQKNARKRNENILKDFEEFERNIHEIELKTKQLRNKKKIYEDKVKELYPQWREKVDLAFARNQLQSYNENVRVQQQSHVPTPVLTYESTPKLKFEAEVQHQSTPVEIVKEERPHVAKAHERRRSSPSPDKIENLEASTELPPPASFAEKIETKPSTSEDVTASHGVTPVINQPEQLSILQDEVSDSDGFESDSFNGSISMEMKNSNNSHLLSKKISDDDGISPEHTSSYQVKSNNSTSLTKNKAPPIVVPAPATKTSVQSFFSESESTSEVSPRNNAPLTSMTAYQAMLKNSGRGISAEDDSNDNLEDILSPRGTIRYEEESPDEDEHDLSEDASDISEVEEHNHYQPTLMASLKEKENMENETTKKSKVPEGNRMPWDLDSDSDDSLGPNSFHGNTTANSWKPQSTMEQDDFDFYD